MAFLRFIEKPFCYTVAAIQHLNSEEHVKNNFSLDIPKFPCSDEGKSCTCFKNYK